MEETQTNNKNFLATINVPELIRTNKYYNMISTIKNYEDSLQKINDSSKKSNLTENPFIFLWPIKKDGANFDLFPNIKDLDLAEFDMELTESIKELVITGPHVRSHINSTQNYPIRKEIYIYNYGEHKWKDIINLEEFTEHKTEYVYENDKKKICLIKKSYRSPAHILLQHDHLKRVGWINGFYYVSSMFLIEYQKHINLYNESFRDPMFDFPYDPLNIYELVDKNNDSPFNVISSADVEFVSKTLMKKEYDILHEISPKSNIKKTCLEYCLDKYNEEQHPMILGQLKQIIILLNQYKYHRPPFLYAKTLKFHENNKDIYGLLVNAPNKHSVDDTSFVPRTINDIDNHIIEQCISTDNVSNFISYIQHINKSIDKEIINVIINYNSTAILTEMVRKNMADEHLIYYAILMTQELDLFKLMEFNLDIALNYLKEILERSLIRSFYFLILEDETVINALFDDNQNILHQINIPDKCVTNTRDLFSLITKIKPDLINLPDDFGETPIIYHSKHNPQIVKILIESDFDPMLFDQEGNSFIHHLCKHDVPDIIKAAIRRYPELLNFPNVNLETPAIISCVNGNEDVFYTLKGLGADLSAQDKFGNTAYHYICRNKLCISMMIENKKNYFGLTPADYCQISQKYYNFIDSML